MSLGSGQRRFFGDVPRLYLPTIYLFIPCCPRTLSQILVNIRRGKKVNEREFEETESHQKSQFAKKHTSKHSQSGIDPHSPFPMVSHTHTHTHTHTQERDSQSVQKTPEDVFAFPRLFAHGYSICGRKKGKKQRRSSKPSQAIPPIRSRVRKQHNESIRRRDRRRVS